MYLLFNRIEFIGKIKLIFKGVKIFIEKEIRTSERKGFWQSL